VEKSIDVAPTETRQERTVDIGKPAVAAGGSAAGPSRNASRAPADDVVIVEASEPVAAKRAPPKPAPKESQALRRYDFSSVTLLLVDQSRFIRNIVSNICRSFGIQRVLEADDAPAAFTLMKQAPIDIVVTEW